MSQAPTYTYSVGGGDFAEQAVLLARSIDQADPQARQVAFLAEDRVDEVDRELLSELCDRAQLVRGPRPHGFSGYPIAEKLEAHRIGAGLGNGGVVVHVDTDTLVLERPDICRYEGGADIAIKPVDYGRGQPWATNGGRQQLGELYEHCGCELDRTTWLSTVDGVRIPALANAGVVVSWERSVPEQWLELTREVWQASGSRYADQISLGMLTTGDRWEHEWLPLLDVESWILPAYLRVPRDTGILRYQEYGYLALAAAGSRRLRQLLRDLDATSLPDWPGPAGLVRQAAGCGAWAVKRRVAGL